MFKAGMKLEAFYNLLVKEITATDKDTVTIEVEHRKDVIEISQKFAQKTNFYRSYIIRTILESLVAVVLICWLCAHGLPVTLEVRNFVFILETKNNFLKLNK